MERLPGISYTSFKSVTPSDTVAVKGDVYWLFVQTAGDIVIKGANDETAVTMTVPNNTWIPFGKGNFVYSTGTTASGIFSCGI